MAAAVATVAVVATGVVAAGVRSLRDAEVVVPPAAGMPAEITMGDVRLRFAGPTEIDSVRALQSEPSVLVVKAGEAPERPTLCEPFVTRARIVSAGATEVRVAAYLYEADLERPDEPFVCAAAHPPVAVLPLDLGAPLGDRSLVDEATGAPVEPLPVGSRLSAAVLPVGYTTRPVRTDAYVDGEYVATQTFTGPDGARLTLEESPDNPFSDDGSLGYPRDVTFGGVEAGLLGNDVTGRKCLVWQEQYAGRRLCTEAAPVTLPTRELLRVAEGLTP